MIARIRKALLVAAVAGFTALGATAAHAQAGATFRVTFENSPHWTTISGTRVGIVREDERPDFDLFRVNDRFYVYNNGTWFVSDTPEGTYSYMEPRFVPVEIRRVPQNYWYSYPTDWSAYDRSDINTYDNDRTYDRDRDRDRTRDYDRGVTVPTTFRIDMRYHPHFNYVSGTNVEEISGRYRPMDYDVFRYHHRYFVYSDGEWFTARHWNDTFMRIDPGAVPAELAQVPRSHWRNYPADWPTPDERHHHHYDRD